MELDNFEFLQKQTEKCREKYKDDLKREWYEWYDGTDNYSHTSVDIIYSKQARACLMKLEQEYADKNKNNYRTISYDIQNLDTWIFYFDCEEDNTKDYAECNVWCEKKKMDTCFWDKDLFGWDVIKTLLEWPYGSKLSKYWFISEDEKKDIEEARPYYEEIRNN